jgi:hypothetical protein
MAAPQKDTASGGLVSNGLADMASACGRARSHIEIASPFLSADVAGFIVRACEDGSARKRRFLTALNDAAIQGGYLDPDGIEEFIAGGFEIRSLRNLHAKVLLTDDRWGLIGSGNLTVAGSNGGNAELGVILGPKQAGNARRDHFDPWWQAGELVDLSALRRAARKRPRLPIRQRREGQGGLFHQDASVDLRSFRTDSRDSGYWLKILYSAEDRMTAEHWQRPMWVSDRHSERPDGGTPLRRPGYRVGDHLVIYVARGERQACPAVVRVTQEPVFDPALVALKVDPDDALQWSWVTWVKPVASIALESAPTLTEIGVASKSVRQQGRIHLNRDQFRRALRLIRGW